MRNVMRNIAAAIGSGLFVLGALSSAFALTIPPTYAPRQFASQQTHYLRFTFNFNSCVFTNSGGAGAVNSFDFCTLKVGALPYNALIVRGWQEVLTAFNSSTTDSISIGVSTKTTDTLIVNQSAINAQITSAPANGTMSIANPGIVATGNGAPVLGADGGFDVFVQYQSKGTPPTAGSVILVLEYIAPNDGNCITPPIGSRPSDVGAANGC